MQRLEDATKIASVTASLEPSYRKMLENIPAENADTICNYILAEITENNIKDSNRGRSGGIYVEPRSIGSGDAHN